MLQRRIGLAGCRWLMLGLGLPLMLACAPVPAEETCSYGLMGTIPFRFAGFPLLMPALEGKVHGTPALLLADTGNFGTQLTMTGALKRQLPLQPSTQRVKGVGGTSRLYNADVSEYSIGTIVSKAMRVPVIGQQASPSTYDGIVGVDFLMQADLEVDYRVRQFKFFKAEHCAQNFLAYWDKNASVIPILPIHSEDSFHPHIIVMLNGIRMNAVIGTGASTTVVTETAARRAGVFPHTPGVREDGMAGGFGSKRGRMWVAKFDDITIGKETLGKPTLNIYEMPRESLGDYDILLGNDFLRAYRVLFANSQGRIYLTRTGNPFPPRSDKAEPWIEQEARAGNPDAHLIMAAKTDDKDQATRLGWIRSAAQLGQPRAQRYLGAVALRDGHPAEAVGFLKSATGSLPSDWAARLELYIAQLEAGDRAGADAGLEAAVTLLGHDAWTKGVFLSFLGKQPLGTAFARHVQGDVLTGQTCAAMQYEPWLRHARPELPPRDAALTALAAECKVPALPVRTAPTQILTTPPATDGMDADKGDSHA